MLIPFWGDLPHGDNDPDRHRFERYMSTGKDMFELVPSMQEADVAILPGVWETHGMQARELALEASASGKAVVVFSPNDSTEEIAIGPNAIVLRTSFYRSCRGAREFAMPGWSADSLRLLGLPGVPVRQKTSRPSVGFCGYVPSPDHIRFRATDALRQSPDVDDRFIVKDQFWGHSWGDDDGVASSREEFLRNLLDSDYGLCARGAGNFSYRLYEVLSCGRIPVFVDTDCVLPYDFAINWPEYGVWVDQSEVSSLPQKVAEFHESLSDIEFSDLQLACRRLWEEWICPEGFFSNFYRHLSASSAQF